MIDRNPDRTLVADLFDLDEQINTGDQQVTLQGRAPNANFSHDITFKLDVTPQVDTSPDTSSSELSVSDLMAG